MEKGNLGESKRTDLGSYLDSSTVIEMSLDPPVLEGGCAEDRGCSGWGQGRGQR